MTFKQLQDDVLERTGLDAVSASSTGRTRVKRLINAWHRRILSDPRFTRLKEGTLSFASVASQTTYAFPSAIQSIRRIFETSTGDQLAPRPQDWYRRSGLFTASGTPGYFCPLGYTALNTGFAGTATGLWAVSTAAGDTTQTVQTDVVRTGGYSQSLTATTLTGTTRVALQAAITDIIDVTKFSVSATTAGTISLYNAASSGTELARIPVGKTQSRYYSILLVPTPSAVLTYQIDYQRQVQDLSADGDEPLWPEDFHWLLSACARYDEVLARKDRSIAEQIWAREIQPGISAMLGAIIDPATALVVPDDHRGTTLGRSNLGSMYPRGIW